MNHSLSTPRGNTHSPKLGEEIANAISHGVGALAAIFGMVLLLFHTGEKGTALSTVSVSLYGASMILLYTVSCLYHSLSFTKAKRVFQIFDHCSIFLLILGTYIPLSFILIGGSLGWILVGINAICTVIGITLNAVSLSRWHKVSLVLYIAMGWLVVAAIYPIYRSVLLYGLLLLLGGGLAYMAGVFFYINKKHAYMHFVWHLFVLLGSTLHYLCIYTYYS